MVKVKIKPLENVTDCQADAHDLFSPHWPPLPQILECSREALWAPLS